MSAPGPNFSAGYDGECGECGWGIEEGDTIAMHDGEAVCEDCASNMRETLRKERDPRSLIPDED